MPRAVSVFFFALSAYAAPAGLGNRPLAFEPNRGQAAPTVRFVARGNPRDYLLSGSGVTVSGASLRFSGANAQPPAVALDPLAERHNYFHGTLSQTDIPTYRRVRYSRLYPGIDCVFYGDQKALEFDLEVSPGADPHKIHFRWRDAKSVHLDANGELVIETASGELRQRKPTIYQERHAQRVLIPGGYALAADGEVRFSIGRYDRTLPLVIDPELFGLDENIIFISAMTADAAGNLYLTGGTSSSILPVTAGAAQPGYGGGDCEITGSGIGPAVPSPCPDVFVIKLNATGQIAYSTYLGGRGFDFGVAIAVDSAGNAYVAGQTFVVAATQNNFPTTPNAAFTKPAGTNGADGFVTKLNPAGSQLLYSTYIPRMPVTSLAVDGQGNAYVVGAASPRDSPFPVTPGALQTSTNAPVTGVVAKLNAAGSALVYATYLGGSGAGDFGDTANAIAVDSTGAAYVTGYSVSADFPSTPGAFQSKLPEPIGIFVSKIAPSGGSLVYSTFLGPGGSLLASGNSRGMAIRVDSQGNATLLGATLSKDFPVTPGAFQSTGPSAPWLADGAGSLNVLSKLNPTGSALVYSTYITGGDSMDMDSSGNAYVLGGASFGFPTTAGAYQGCSHGGAGEIYAVEFAPDGKLNGATYLGGSGADTASSIIALGDGSVALAGTTDSIDFPGIAGSHSFSLAFVASILINDPNHPAGVCLTPAIQNAASFAEGSLGVAPGEIVTLRGKGIGPEKGLNAVISPGGKVPTELGGAQVFVCNHPAPLLYVQSEQINAIVPWSAQTCFPNLGVPVEVRYNGASIKTSVNLFGAAPGIFLSDYSTLQAAVLNEDGTRNSPTNPAKRGSVISFYGTGGGMLDPPGVDGGIWPSALSHLVLPVAVQIDNVNAEVKYAGSAPGLVSGIFQINARVPDLIAPQPRVSILVTIDGISSALYTAFVSVE